MLLNLLSPEPAGNLWPRHTTYLPTFCPCAPSLTLPNGAVEKKMTMWTPWHHFWLRTQKWHNTSCDTLGTSPNLYGISHRDCRKFLECFRHCTFISGCLPQCDITTSATIPLPRLNLQNGGYQYKASYPTLTRNEFRILKKCEHHASLKSLKNNCLSPAP